MRTECECPKCRKMRFQHLATSRSEAKEAYGKVSMNRFEIMLMKVERARENTGRDQDDTLQEDFEAGIKNDKFRVTYSAYCSVCGFRFKHEHTEAVSYE